MVYYKLIVEITPSNGFELRKPFGNLCLLFPISLKTGVISRWFLNRMVECANLQVSLYPASVQLKIEQPK